MVPGSRVESDLNKLREHNQAKINKFKLMGIMHFSGHWILPPYPSWILISCNLNSKNTMITFVSCNILINLLFTHNIKTKWRIAAHRNEFYPSTSSKTSMALIQYEKQHHFPVNYLLICDLHIFSQIFPKILFASASSISSHRRCRLSRDENLSVNNEPHIRMTDL